MPTAPYDSMPVNDPISMTIPSMVIPDPEFLPQIDLNLDQSFSWEMIGLGLEEPMPTQEAVNELYDRRAPSSSDADKIEGLIFTLTKYIYRYQWFINIDIIHPWI